MAELGRFRSYVWPIHRSELKKLLPMLLMAFLTAIVYEMLRSMKESPIVTAAGSGAEVIPFLKVWVMLPIAILLTTIFVKLSQRFSSEKVYYILVTSFLLFFALFAFGIYPLRESLHLHAFADRLETILPRGCSGLISMIRYWSFSLFYAVAEAWGVICLMILFWGFANEITSVTQATRFYGILCLGSNVATIFAGRIAHFMSQHQYNPNWPIGQDAWHQALILLTFTILVAGILLMTIFRWLNVKIVRELHHSIGNKKLEKLKSKKRSIRESFGYLTKSKYLMSIATIVLSYNIFINLVEVLWKSKVKLIYTTAPEYTAYMSNVTFVTGIIATMSALLLSGNMIRKCGWTKTALLTPIVLVITSAAFFTCYLFPQDKLGILAGLLSTTPVGLIVLVGAIQNSFSRGAKYTIFDETKEICFIPLPRDIRVNGKAAIDGVTSRLGKSGGSLLYQGMLFAFGELSAVAPYIAGVLFFVLSGWMIAVRRLGRLFGKAVETQEEESQIAEQPQAV